MQKLQSISTLINLEYVYIGHSTIIRKVSHRTGKLLSRLVSIMQHNTCKTPLNTHPYVIHGSAGHHIFIVV